MVRGSATSLGDTGILEIERGGGSTAGSGARESGRGAISKRTRADPAGAGSASDPGRGTISGRAASDCGCRTISSRAGAQPAASGRGGGKSPRRGVAPVEVLDLLVGSLRAARSRKRS